ncbi:hypothetical protein Cba03nite_12290 [Catellatospora bangladeshensis]|uniref:AAA domain-containing protein n=1 Tax=Catellatospora bangladeshensis TaxID=310355 RepID=A0A8J3NIZ4_9ACTN|nr:hypothetical protein Cba03nite_12290 [Catellatospora bangladeshensis]
MLACTRALVEAEMARLPLSTYDTVLVDTPACLATSAIVTTLSRCADRRVLPFMAAPACSPRAVIPAVRRTRSREPQLAHDDAGRVTDQV